MGIPTMQGGVETIRPYVDEFIAFADEWVTFEEYNKKPWLANAGQGIVLFWVTVYDTSMDWVTLNKSLTLGNSKASFHYTRLIAIFCFGSI